MSKLKVLSGKQVLKIFESFGFDVAFQRGSHIKIKRVQTDGSQQTLTIPNHKMLDKGTLHAIFNQASRFISEEELKKYFYH